ncbi:MAG: fumarylacetoacetase [Blastocatellia bacterium]
MIITIDETHNPELRSWLDSANDSGTDFPIQNLPFCAIWTEDEDEPAHLSIAIGDKIFDLVAASRRGLLEGKIADLLLEGIGDLSTLSEFFPEDLRRLRASVSAIFLESAPKAVIERAEKCLIPISQAEFEIPLTIGDYTDFYCSIYHATNVGSMFRPDNPLMPNYKWLPVGYHGRASSIVISGTEIRRPRGQNRSNPEMPPAYIPCKNLDYEVELGFFVGRSNELGEPVAISDAEEHILGFCLVNDWSARDIQAWEYQPLGPFLSKNFATSVSPFIVTREALMPFRSPAFERPPNDPKPLGYLQDADNEENGGLDVILEVYLQTEKMREGGIEPFRLSRSNTKDLYWTVGQMLTHHSSNGCNLQCGDLLATGTVSGRKRGELGCLLEITRRGSEPIRLPSGEERRFLENGDEVIIKGFCEREGFRRIGFGDCRGRILPAE